MKIVKEAMDNLRKEIAHKAEQRNNYLFWLGNRKCYCGDLEYILNHKREK